MLGDLPGWVTLLRAPNPGPMTLDGTNSWVLRVPGADRCVLVDPGPAIGPHLAAIESHAPVGLILITHGHPDHVDGLAHAVEMLGGPPVVAADPAFRTGATPAEANGLSITELSTPGHTADSLCFFIRYGDERVMLTGDTILGRGTTVVAWPDGNLAQYLASLRALSGYRQIMVLPGHGPPLPDCGAVADFYLAHREERLAQVRAAVAEGAVTPDDVVAHVYADVDRALWPAATLSVRAQLDYLSRESHPGGARLEAP